MAGHKAGEEVEGEHFLEKHYLEKQSSGVSRVSAPRYGWGEDGPQAPSEAGLRVLSCEAEWQSDLATTLASREASFLDVPEAEVDSYAYNAFSDGHTFIEVREEMVDLSSADEEPGETEARCADGRGSVENGSKAVRGARKKVDTSDIKRRLHVAQEMASKRRWRVSGSMIVSGILLMPSSFALWFFAAYGTVLHLVGMICAPIGCVFSLLAVLPSDRRIIFEMSKVFVLLLVLLAAWNVYSTAVTALLMQTGTCQWSSSTMGPCWLVALGVAVGIVAFVVFPLAAVGYIVFCYFRGPARTLTCLWGICGFGWMVAGISHVLTSFAGFVALQWSQHDGLALCGAVVELIIAVIVVRAPNFRERVQDWLANQGEAIAAAAGIANFLGGHAVEDIISEAKATFYCISCDRILRADIEDNVPNPSLRQKAEKARFGQVDAFLSHSWQDDKDLKWNALQAWRKEFKDHFGREPLLWLDKYCIDQEDIAASLRCLPVYLAACNNLVALCGATYLKRLWCLMEIFIFIEMGGSVAALDIMVLSPDQDMEVDPRQGRCTTDEDTARLRGVLEGGLNGLQHLIDIIQGAIRLSPALAPD